jgi:hypothetical protein
MNNEWDFLNINTKLDGISVDGVYYKTGDRVRVHPTGRADIMDMAIEGMTAVIEAIEQDFENKVYFALVLDDDPGKELGMMRQPGHRFFYTPAEVVLLGNDE